MAKLVTKWRYLKPDAARHAQAYIRYIATREGVEKYVEENGARPAAQAQRVLVEKLLRDFPDARRSFEYEDYAVKRNEYCTYIISYIRDNIYFIF